MKSSATKTSTGAAGPGLPLPALLSQTLVAFTIELDNQAEQQMVHRTTTRGLSKSKNPGEKAPLHAPWLVSLVMWSNCMQFVGEDGVRVGELEELARTKTNLDGMERWGYVTVEPDPADQRPKPPRSDWVIRATPAGRKAQEVWRPLFGMIEELWQERFGEDEIDQLRKSLLALIAQIDVDLPDCLPILEYGLFSRRLDRKRRKATERQVDSGTRLPLPALLSKVLLAFALQFEHDSDLSLAISANLVRVLDEKGIPVRDLPRLAGVSKEAIKMAMGILTKGRYVVVESDPVAARTKLIRLTPKGQAAKDAYLRRLAFIEQRWQERFGEDNHPQSSGIA